MTILLGIPLLKIIMPLLTWILLFRLFSMALDWYKQCLSSGTNWAFGLNPLRGQIGLLG